MPHGTSPPPGVACTTNKEGSKDTNRFQALYRPEHAALKQGLRRGSGQLSALIHRGAWKGNSRKLPCRIVYSPEAGVSFGVSRPCLYNACVVGRVVLPRPG